MTQLFPGVVLGLFWKRTTKTAVVSGLLTGLAVVIFLIVSHHDPFMGINAGFLGLAVNLVIAILISYFKKPAKGEWSWQEN